MKSNNQELPSLSKYPSVPGGHVEPVADDEGDAAHDESEPEGGHEDRDEEGHLLLLPGAAAASGAVAVSPLEQVLIFHFSSDDY